MSRKGGGGTCMLWVVVWFLRFTMLFPFRSVIYTCQV